MRTKNKRRVYEVLTAFTLVLIATAVVCGVRGYFVHDGAAVWLGGRSLQLASFRGGLELSAAADTRGLRGRGLDVGYASVPPDFVDRQWEPKRPQVEAWRVRLAGFSFAIGTPDKAYSHNGVWVPFRVVLPAWFVVLILIVISGGLRRRRRKLLWLERTAAGLCGACGYDLRATPGKCPECGSGAERAPSGRMARRWSGPAGRVRVASFWRPLIRPARPLIGPT